jgi:uncharacterized membrane protein
VLTALPVLAWVPIPSAYEQGWLSGWVVGLVVVPLLAVYNLVIYRLRRRYDTDYARRRNERRMAGQAPRSAEKVLKGYPKWW